MKRFCFLAVLMALSSSAHAGGSISFNVGGHRVHIESSRYCRSTSCASVSISGVSRKFGRKDDDRDTVAPVTTTPPVPQSASPPPPPPAAAPAAQTVVTPPPSAAYRPAASTSQEVAAPPPAPAASGAYDFARDAWFNGEGGVGLARAPPVIIPMPAAPNP